MVRVFIFAGKSSMPWGLLDAKLTSLEQAIKDWVYRASMLGFMARRANHAYVHRGPIRVVIEAFHRDLGRRNRVWLGSFRSTGISIHQLKRFQKSLDGRLAAHAVGQSTGRLRVAYDIRHLRASRSAHGPMPSVWGRHLGKISEIELTLLVRSRLRPTD